MTKNINSTVSPLKHLNWNLGIFDDFVLNKITLLAWFAFFLFPLFYEGNNFGFLFGLLTLITITYNYYKDKSVGSMWCWIVNSIMVYYAGYLLFYLPFFK